jgi:DNA polymerase III subunit delta'
LEHVFQRNYRTGKYKTAVNPFSTGREGKSCSIFSGPEGTGALGLALAYAQYISCNNRSETDSCGTCPSCHKYRKLAHPDLHFVFPVFNSPKYKNPVSDDFIKEWREMVLKNHYFNLRPVA